MLNYRVIRSLHIQEVNFIVVRLHCKDVRLENIGVGQLKTSLYIIGKIDIEFTEKGKYLSLPPPPPPLLRP